MVRTKQTARKSSGQPHRVACPICQKQVQHSKVNEHMDLCIQTPPPAKPSKKKDWSEQKESPSQGIQSPKTPLTELKSTRPNRTMCNLCRCWVASHLFDLHVKADCPKRIRKMLPDGVIQPRKKRRLSASFPLDLAGPTLDTSMGSSASSSTTASSMTNSNQLSTTSSTTKSSVPLSAPPNSLVRKSHSLQIPTVGEPSTKIASASLLDLSQPQCPSPSGARTAPETTLAGSTSSGDSESECPLCFLKMSTNVIQRHASTCFGVPSGSPTQGRHHVDLTHTSSKSSDAHKGSVSVASKEEADSDGINLVDDPYTPCPICTVKFKQSLLQGHVQNMHQDILSSSPIKKPIARRLSSSSSLSQDSSKSSPSASHKPALSETLATKLSQNSRADSFSGNAQSSLGRSMSVEEIDREEFKKSPPKRKAPPSKSVPVLQKKRLKTDSDVDTSEDEDESAMERQQTEVLTLSDTVESFGSETYSAFSTKDVLARKRSQKAQHKLTTPLHDDGPKKATSQSLSDILGNLFDGSETPSELRKHLSMLEFWVFNDHRLFRVVYPLLFNRLWHGNTPYRLSLEIFKTLKKLHACAPADWTPTREDWPLFDKCIQFVTDLEYSIKLLEEEQRKQTKCHKCNKAIQYLNATPLCDDEDCGKEKDYSNDSRCDECTVIFEIELGFFHCPGCHIDVCKKCSEKEKFKFVKLNPETFLKQVLLLLTFYVDVFDKDIKSRQKLQKNEKDIMSQSLLAVLIRDAEKHENKGEDSFVLRVMEALTNVRAEFSDPRVELDAKRICRRLSALFPIAFPHLSN